MAKKEISDEAIKEAILDRTIDMERFKSRMYAVLQKTPQDILCNNIAYKLGVPEDSIKERFKKCWHELFGGENVPQELTAEIRIVPAGMKMIGIFDPEDDCPPQYRNEERFHKDIYGVTAARVTVYNVRVVPLKKEYTPALLHRVKYALGEAAKQHHDFEPPNDLSIATEDTYWHPSYSWRAEKLVSPNVVVDEADGCIVFQDDYYNGPLDLDDLWRFYKALGPWARPSQQIAEALNMARHVEERSPLLELDVFGDNTYNARAPLDAENQLGNLYRVPREKALQAVLVHMTALYARGITDRETLTQQAQLVALLTLTGHIPDYSGLLPETEQQQSIDKLIEKRARDILAFISGGDADDDDEKLSLKLKAMRINKREVVQQLIDEVQSRYLDAVGEYLRRWERNPGFNRKPESGQEQGIPEENGRKLLTGNGQDATEDDLSALMRLAGLETTAQNVTFHLPRSFEDTEYTSKPFGISPRYEMPEKLQPFLSAHARLWFRSVLIGARPKATPSPE